MRSMRYQRPEKQLTDLFQVNEMVFDCAQGMNTKMMQMGTRQFSISTFLYHLQAVIELAHFDT